MYEGPLYGGLMFNRGLCPGGLCPGISVMEIPRCTVTSGRYASYWNAFLFES